MAALEQRAPFRDVLHCFGDPAGGIRYVSFSGQPIFDQRNNVQRLSRHRARRERADSRRALGAARAHRSRARSRKPTTADGRSAPSSVRCASRERWTAGNFWSVDAQRDTLRHGVGWSADGDGSRAPCSTSASGCRTGCSQRPRLDRRRDARSAHAARSSASQTDGLEYGSGRSGEDRRHDPRGSRFLRAANRGTRAAVLAGLARRERRNRPFLSARAGDRERLRESEERFSSTMELAAIGIAHVDDGGVSSTSNPQLCEMLGYTEQELLRADREADLAPGRRQRHRRPARPAARGRHQVVQDGEALSAQGRLGRFGSGSRSPASAIAPGEC